MFLLLLVILCCVLALLISVYQGVKLLIDLFRNWGLHTTPYKVKYSLLFAWDFIRIALSVYMLCSIYSATVN